MKKTPESEKIPGMRERERECGRGAAGRATGLTHGWPYFRSV